MITQIHSEIKASFPVGFTGHYSYDIHGNIQSLLQDNRKMAVDFPALAFSV
ncbi:MAG: hypothetical protein WC223_11010 [Bacteroidales bacterium]|jgi:hypothetical protein